MVQIHTVEDLTEVFESIASMRISKIHNRVIASKEFFAELWTTYRSLRVDPKERLKRPNQAERARNVFVAITAEGKLSGGVDEQIITTMLEARKDPANTDVIVIGSHGVSQLQQHKVPASHTFKMPVSDVSFSVADVIEALNKYHQISVFYQTYDSLRVQKVARIELISAVRELGKDVTEEDKNIEIVTSRDYIFEPNIDKIANYMESVMMGVALIQVIMESKLAQYANRFNTMSRAKIRARDLTDEYRRQFYRAKRAESDERQKEIIKVVRSHERHWAN